MFPCTKLSGMVSHGFNPSTGEAEAGRPAEFKDSLVYMWSGVPDSQDYIERPWGGGEGEGEGERAQDFCQPAEGIKTLGKDKTSAAACLPLSLGQLAG